LILTAAAPPPLWRAAAASDTDIVKIDGNQVTARKRYEFSHSSA
jgi:hypothetical protein